MGVFSCKAEESEAASSRWGCEEVEASSSSSSSSSLLPPSLFPVGRGAGAGDTSILFWALQQTYLGSRPRTHSSSSNWNEKLHWEISSFSAYFQHISQQKDRLPEMTCQWYVLLYWVIKATAIILMCIPIRNNFLIHFSPCHENNILPHIQFSIKNHEYRSEDTYLFCVIINFISTVTQ